MAFRNIYSTNDAMRDGGPSVGQRNALGSALGVGSDENGAIYFVGVFEPNSDVMAVASIDRAELRLLRDAIDAELKTTEN